LKIENTTIKAHIIDNFAGRYNHCIKCFNESSFEVNYENESKKMLLRGSRFFFQKVVLTIYIILFIIDSALYQKDVQFNGTLLAVCLIYWLLLLYNFYVVYKNGNIIAKNFVYSKDLCDKFINEFYDIELEGIVQNAGLATNLESLVLMLQEKRIHTKVKIMAYYSTYLKRTKPTVYLVFYLILNSIIIYFLCDFISKS